MFNRTQAALFFACLIDLQISSPAQADNQMGYRILTAEQAASLPRSTGRLGLNVGPGQQISSGGLTFELLRVNAVTSGSAAAQAGFRLGDQIIAVDGRVFPSVIAFASYVGAMSPGREISVDYMPGDGGPKDAQRISVQIGGSQQQPVSQPTRSHSGLSGGQKAAIGVGAAALFGCYELGCFAHKSSVAPQ